MKILFGSTNLLQKAIKHYSDRGVLNKTDEGYVVAYDLRLELLNRDPDINNWQSISAGLSKNKQFVIFDDRYDHLKSASFHGLQTIWFNPNGELAPEVVPVQDGDIQKFDDLMGAASSLQIPALSQCYTWWDEWGLPENICQHSLTVSHAAYTLAVWMRNKGIKINPILTHRAGMLHDLDKIKTLNSTGTHGQIAAAFLERNGYPDVAEIVREHIISTILEPDADQRSWEVKLVYYCDKIAEGNQLVPFNQRLTALFERYPHYKSVMQQAEQPVWALDERICSILSIRNHEKLLELLTDSRAEVQ